MYKLRTVKPNQKFPFSIKPAIFHILILKEMLKNAPLHSIKILPKTSDYRLKEILGQIRRTSLKRQKNLHVLV